MAIGGVKRANYACKNGFDSNSGKFTIPCSDGKNWDTREALSCRDRDDGPKNDQCPAPPLGANTELTDHPDDSGLEQTAVYKCKDGYVFSSGSAAITCVNGRWRTEGLLMCKAMSIARGPEGRRNGGRSGDTGPSIDRADP